jgi:hypothetical protein
MLARQKLPEIPPNPPPLLEPILKHLSIDIGLDDLSLLDLRKLDPPPALGGNLLMILGTARSEKHLHVSADRFCRWLRTEYALKPYADGLLGRNELKLKMRRKARRARLLGSVISVHNGDDDDGIRTGWICANVGLIGEGDATTEESAYSDDVMTSDDFVGFGGHISGVKLVVQMLTEAKREELDLETLWGGFLSRQERKEAREAEKLLAEAKKEEVGYTISGCRLPAADICSPSFSSPSVSKGPQPRLSRLFHTSIIRDQQDSAARRSASFARETDRLESIHAEPTLVPKGPPPSMAEAPQTLAVLQKLLVNLKELSVEDALERLGKGYHDRKSTPFLSSFYQNIPLFPNMDHLALWMDFVCFAFSLGHPGYRKSNVEELFRIIQSTCIPIPREVYEMAIITLLQNRATAPQVPTPTIAEIVQLRRQEISQVMDLLEEMSLRSYQVLTEPVCIALIIAMAGSQCNTPDCPFNSDALDRLMISLDQCSDQSNLLLDHRFIMETLAGHGDWPSFWLYWRSFPKRLQRRSQEMYTDLCYCLADSMDQGQCFYGLNEWLPEIDAEEPAVPLTGPLADAVMKCLLVINPIIMEQAQASDDHPGQWVRLWRRCLDGLSEPGEDIEGQNRVQVPVECDFENISVR